MFRRRKPVGTPAVAVIVRYGRGRTSGETPPESRSRNGSMPTEAVVQVVGDDRRQEVRGRVTGLGYWMMAEGDEIPVLVDADGTVTGFDRLALHDLYAPRKAELKESLKPHSVVNDLRRSVGLDRESLENLGPAAREFASVPRKFLDAVRTPIETPVPTVEPAPPIDGVSFWTFVAVQAALVRDKVPTDRHDEVAGTHGVAPGVWSTAQEQWMGLVRSDPAVAQAFGAAYAAAMEG